MLRSEGVLHIVADGNSATLVDDLKVAKLIVGMESIAQSDSVAIFGPDRVIAKDTLLLSVPYDVVEIDGVVRGEIDDDDTVAGRGDARLVPRDGITGTEMG